MGQPHMSQREFLQSLLPLTKSIIASIDALPAAYAGAVLRAILVGDTRTIDDYFRKQLGRDRRPEELLALYTILSRSPTWRKVKGLNLTKYLGQSVRWEGRAIRDKWDRDGLLSPERREREARAARELERSRARALRPDVQLEHKEASEFRNRVWERVKARIREKGTNRDCMMLDLLEKGRTPALAIAELGLKMTAWESLRRKMGRWGAQERKILRSEMSSRRVSAA